MRLSDIFSQSDTDSDSSSELREYKKRKRSVIDGCNCDLDALPERFLLYKVEKEIGTIVNLYDNFKVYDLEKQDWLFIKRTLRDLLSTIKEMKNE